MKSSLCACVTAASIALACSLSTPAAAQSEPAESDSHSGSGSDSDELRWQPHWRRFHAAEYVVTGAALGTYLYLELATDYASRAKWKGPILFDEQARDLLRGRNYGARDTAAILSDVGSIVPQVQALALDPLAIWTFHDDFDAGWQVALMSAEALSLAVLTTRILMPYSARARPSVKECEKNEDYEPLCGAGSYSSFPSGHTQMAVTAAALTCSHHANLPIYGGGAGDVANCAIAIGMAGSNAVLRITADRHYASDVLVGMGFGLLYGLGVPWLHYRDAPEKKSTAEDANLLRWSMLPWATPDGVLGAQSIGLF